MTSKKTMLSWTGLGQLVVLGISIAASSSCVPRIVKPYSFISPYPASKVWAVVPLRNEAGTTLVDGTRLADHLVNQIQQINGISALPLNRVLRTMEANNIEQVNSIGEIITMINVLKVDGLIVGTVSAWDPYEPPKIGAAIQLYAGENPRHGSSFDSRVMTRAATSTDLPYGTTLYSQPVAQVSQYFDAANGTILSQLSQYAKGRTAIDNPAGWRRYLLDMDLYCEFVSHELIVGLLNEEYYRLTAQQQQLEENTDAEKEP